MVPNRKMLNSALMTRPAHAPPAMLMLRARFGSHRSSGALAQTRASTTMNGASVSLPRHAQVMKMKSSTGRRRIAAHKANTTMALANDSPNAVLTWYVMELTTIAKMAMTARLDRRRNVATIAAAAPTSANQFNVARNRSSALSEIPKLMAK